MDDYAREMMDLKTLVTRTLEKKGVLARIRKLKSMHYDKRTKSSLFGSLWPFLRRCLFSVLSYGPMPNHIAFIMDGNRRYAKGSDIKHDAGHRAGFTALTTILQYCYEMGVKYVTVYAFSIDNFKREPEEVQYLMDLMKEKIEELLKEDSIINKYGFKLNFWGDLSLLKESVRSAAQKAMKVTSMNTGPVLSVCVAYTSTREIVHAVEEAIKEKKYRIRESRCNGCNAIPVLENDIDASITVFDLDRNMYTSDCPDPDIVIRTSGETRLSNFLLWQTTLSHLQNPSPLWPEFSLGHLVWAVLKYQRVQPYLYGRSPLNKKDD